MNGKDEEGSTHRIGIFLLDTGRAGLGVLCRDDRDEQEGE